MAEKQALASGSFSEVIDLGRAVKIFYPGMSKVGQKNNKVRFGCAGYGRDFSEFDTFFFNEGIGCRVVFRKCPRFPYG